MDEITQNRIKGLASLIGNTPLIEIRFKYKNQERTIYAKAENLNFTGSIKDRMAYYILKAAYKRGELQAGDRIIEATSGNTGIAFSAIGRALGHPVTIFMPDWMSNERKNLIKSLGADIVLVSKDDGGFLGSIEMAEKFAKQCARCFLPRQFSNEANIDTHFQTTGKEIWWQLRFREMKPDAFVAGVGTGGTVMGVGRFLKSQSDEIKIHPLEPVNSPTMSTGYKVGKHRIQGISDEFIPELVKLDELDEIISVDDGDAIIMAQMLASALGLGVGISSGANFLGALMVQEQLGSNKCVVTILPDDNKKYLSTDLLKCEPVKESFISTGVELLAFRGLKRVCFTCCEPNQCEEANYYRDHTSLERPTCPKR